MGKKYTHINTSATTIVRSTAGQLVNVLINSASTGTCTLYDNASVASGSVIAVINTNPTNGTGGFEYEVDVANGIVAVTTGTADITITSKNQV